LVTQLAGIPQPTEKVDKVNIDGNKNEEPGKRRVPKLKSEMQMRNKISYTHALNVMKVEQNQVANCLTFRMLI